MTSKKLQEMQDKILHIFNIYPKISPSMLQISLNLPAALWKPILEDLIVCDKVRRGHLVSPTPSGRHQTYTILSKTEDKPKQSKQSIQSLTQ